MCTYANIHTYKYVQGKIEAETGRALFAGTFCGKTYRFALQQPPGTVGALVLPLQDNGEEGGGIDVTVLAKGLSEWFSNLEVDLDG